MPDARSANLRHIQESVGRGAAAAVLEMAPILDTVWIETIRERIVHRGTVRPLAIDINANGHQLTLLFEVHDDMVVYKDSSGEEIDRRTVERAADDRDPDPGDHAAWHSKLAGDVDVLFTENQELYALLARAKAEIWEFVRNEATEYGGKPAPTEVMREIDDKLKPS